MSGRFGTLCEPSVRENERVYCLCDTPRLASGATSRGLDVLYAAELAHHFKNVHVKFFRTATHEVTITLARCSSVSPRTGTCSVTVGVNGSLVRHNQRPAAAEARWDLQVSWFIIIQDNAEVSICMSCWPKTWMQMQSALCGLTSQKIHNDRGRVILSRRSPFLVQESSSRRMLKTRSRSRIGAAGPASRQGRAQPKDRIAQVLYCMCTGHAEFYCSALLCMLQPHKSTLPVHLHKSSLRMLFRLQVSEGTLSVWVFAMSILKA